MHTAKLHAGMQTGKRWCKPKISLYKQWEYSKEVCSNCRSITLNYDKAGTTGRLMLEIRVRLQQHYKKWLEITNLAAAGQHVLGISCVHQIGSKKSEKPPESTNLGVGRGYCMK